MSVSQGQRWWWGVGGGGGGEGRAKGRGKRGYEEREGGEGGRKCAREGGR